MIKKIGLFAAGVLFGTAGIRLLTSKDAKKVYTHATAAVLRAKEDVMTTVTNVRENCNDILADAKAINEQRAEAEKAEVIEDTSCECAEAEEAVSDEKTENEHSLHRSGAGAHHKRDRLLVCGAHAPENERACILHGRSAAENGAASRSSAGTNCGNNAAGAHIAGRRTSGR